MRAVRRLYLYLVALLSLEVVLWGLIGLARESADATTIGGGAQRLSMALALLLVGAPVFSIHWGLAQNLAQRVEEERASSTRALFLYAVLLTTLIPCLQNLLALLTRALLRAVALPSSLAWVGGRQTWSDNLIAIAMNALVAAWFWWILQKDWAKIASPHAFADTRRLYRYLWLFYGLTLLIIGTQQLLRFILTPQPDALTYRAVGAGGINGLMLAIVGAGVWAASELTIQRSLVQEAERQSLLRLAVLYLLSLAGVGSVLTAGAMVIYWLLRLLLGEALTFAGLLERITTPLSVGISLGGLWAYYGNVLARTLKEVPDAPQRAAMRRLYFYLLSAAGLTATFIGLNQLLRFVTEVGWLYTGSLSDAMRSSLASALAMLLAGLPLWLLTWQPMQGEASATDEAGDHARRSVIRKTYLYLALFAGVVGGMTSAGRLIYLLLLSVFGQPPADLTFSLLGTVRLLLLFSLLGVYHALLLRSDGRLAEAALLQKQAAFPVLVLDPEDGFAQRMSAALKEQAPAIPLVLATLPTAVEVAAEVRAAVLPFDILLTLPAPWRTWLAGFDGYRVIVPRAEEKWLWGSGALAGEAMVRRAAQTLRHLAEERPVRTFGIPSGWLIGLSILGALFLLQILVSILMLGMSALLD